jgi:hypothetical protein
MSLDHDDLIPASPTGLLELGTDDLEGLSGGADEGLHLLDDGRRSIISELLKPRTGGQAIINFPRPQNKRASTGRVPITWCNSTPEQRLLCRQ